MTYDVFVAVPSIGDCIGLQDEFCGEVEADSEEEALDMIRVSLVAQE